MCMPLVIVLSHKQNFSSWNLTLSSKLFTVTSIQNDTLNYCCWLNFMHISHDHKLLLLNILSSTYHHSHFLATILDFTSFFIMAFLPLVVLIRFQFFLCKSGWLRRFVVTAILVFLLIQAAVWRLLYTAINSRSLKDDF